MPGVNPFIFDRPVSDPSAFWNRDDTKKLLRRYLEKGQCCQVVAPDGFGKSSLLLCLGAFAKEWGKEFIFAYVDMADPRNQSVDGFIDTAERGWGVADSLPVKNRMYAFPTLSRLADDVEALKGHGIKPVLCLDNFEAVIDRRDIFTNGFFGDLRYIAQRDMPIVTASRQTLDKVVPSEYLTSPFFNIFGLVYLSRFSDDDAHDFVVTKREGVEPFTAEERNVILEFAAGHPLKLQTACFEVLEAKRKGDSTASAIVRAMNAASLHTAA